MRIAGICPQKLELDTKIQHAVGEPYGLEMILAVAKQEGHDVDLFVPARLDNGNISEISEQEFVDNIVKYRPDVAAFSLYTAQYPAGKRIASEIKKRLPKTKIVAGNRYPSFLKQGIENPFDFFVIKEGEQTFRELLKAMQNGQKYEEIPGMTFMKDNDRVFTGDRQRNFELDALPNALRFPIIMNQVYRGISLPTLSSNPKYGIVESSRCCYNKCKFCDNRDYWGNKVAFRSAKRVVGEMAELKGKGTDIFYFMDLNFTAFPNKTRELCEEMVKQNLNASWYCMSNTATVDSELGKDKDFLKMMKEAGCFKIAWGIESTSDSALERMDKSVANEYTKTNMTERVLQRSLDAGLLNQGFYIVGFPWETEESIVRDAEKLKYIPMHILNIGVFTPIPLSRFYQEMDKEGYVFDPNLENHDRNTLVYNHKSLDNKKVKELQEKIHGDFYASPEYQARIKETCRIDPRFKQAFNEYFEFTGKGVRV